jgi:hypothetical protein
VAQDFRAQAEWERALAARERQRPGWRRGVDPDAASEEAQVNAVLREAAANLFEWLAGP